MSVGTRGAQDATQDRQRERAARGIGKKSGSAATGRPAPPRRRRPALALLGVLLIIGGATLAGLLALRMDSRDPMLMLRVDVPAGTEITSDMLVETNVSADSELLISADNSGTVIGTYARIPLSAGQLLDTSMLVRTAVVGSGQVAQVGVPLVPGRVPAGLRSGDVVRIVQLGDGNNNPGRPLAQAIVLSTSMSEGGGGLVGGGDSVGSGAASLLIPTSVADAVIDAAGNDRLGLALIERGASTDDTSKLRSLAVGP